MQKILISLFILFFINISNSQNYLSKRLAYNLSRPTFKYGNTSYSPVKLKLAIKLDSTLARSYYYLANYYQNKENYLTNKGSIYYYYKFLDVDKRFPSNLFSYDYEIKELVEKRLVAVTSAYNKNPEFFKNDNKLSDFTKSELIKIVNECINDIEKHDLNNGYGGLSHTTFKTYMLKAQLDYDKNDIDSYLTTCKVILDKTKGKTFNEEFRLELYDDMIKKLLKIGDTMSASLALNENLKEYKLKERNNLDYRNKEKQLITLLNYKNNIHNDKYDVCSSDANIVFCRNKNIRIANYSSALKFWNTYFQENSIFFDNLIENDGTLKNVYHYNMQRYFGFKYEYIPILYNFYLTKGKELGMIWPLYGGFQRLIPEYFWGENLQKLIEVELTNSLSNVYDIIFLETTNVYQQRINTISSSNRFTTDKLGVSDSVVVADIFLEYPETYKHLLNVPVKYFDGNKKQIFTNGKGQTLPSSTSFKKFHEIEKQRYENEQALNKARQVQQQEELKRLEQERLNRETQIRLIEEENERKQKEIDLVNAENKQIENNKKTNPYEEIGAEFAKNILGDIAKDQADLKKKGVPKHSVCKCGKKFITMNGWYCDGDFEKAYDVKEYEAKNSSFMFGNNTLSSLIQKGFHVDFPKYCGIKCAKLYGRCY